MRDVHLLMLERLEQARKSEKLSRAKLAELAGMKLVTLNKLVARLRKRDGYGTLDTWIRLSSVLHKSIDYLTCRDITEHVPLDAPTDEFPARARAVAAAWLLGFDEDVIKSVYQVPGDSNLSTKWWFDFMLAKSKR